MLSTREKWRSILSGVDTSDAPVTVLNNIVVSLSDGSSVDIKVNDLIKQGVSERELKSHIGSKLNEWDHIIDNVDFYIKVESVADFIQPITDNLLKELR